MAKTDDDENSRDRIIGRNLTAIRGERTQQWIADQMRPRGFEWSQATLWAIEKGKRPLRLAEADALAEVFNIDLHDLLRLPAMVELQELIDSFVKAEDALVRAAEWMEESLRDIAVLADRMIADGAPQEEVQFWLDGMGYGLVAMWTPSRYLTAMKPVRGRDIQPIGRYTQRYLDAPIDDEVDPKNGQRKTTA